jgi:peptide/nickel transport system permease protein
MATVSSSAEQPIAPRARAGGRWKALSRAFGYARRNPALTIGVLLLASLLLFAVVGAEVYGTANVAPLSVAVNQPPSATYPLGTDQQARDMLAVIIAGTPLTVEIGLIAGVIGTVIGTVLAFAAGYYRGFVDTLIRTLVDVGLTVPSLVILIVIAISVHGNLTVSQVGLVVASTAWLWPTRSMRSQVLSLRERTYVQVARLSGMGGPEIIVREMIPNLIPYIAASLVIAISQAVLASIGLEALGLGSLNSPTLGMTIYWAIYNSALIQGSWWVWAPAIVVIVILFMGLFLVSVGLDSVANPRLRRAA